MRAAAIVLVVCGCASAREPATPAKTPAPAVAAPPTLDELATQFASGGRAQFVNVSRGEIAADYAGMIRERVRDVSEVTESRVFVVALPSEVDPNGYAALHQKLSLAKRDVLFVFSRKKRHLHCQAIPIPDGKDILAGTRESFYNDAVVGALATLDEVGFYLHTRKGAVTL